MTRQGVPSSSLDIMLASLAKNTISQYSSSLKSWWKFCNRNNVDVYQANSFQVMSFLTKKFENGASYSTINTCRSALSIVLGQKTTQDESINRLIKGMYRINPPRPKYKSTWDPSVVLRYLSDLSPYNVISFKDLSYKTITLLAIASAQRMQTLSLIKINNISINPNYITIKVDDLIKTSRPGSCQPLIKLPFIKENPKICPAFAIQSYLERTVPYRTTEYLFISIKKPHKEVTSQTLGHWVKHVLELSGVDVSMYGAHSTRHASTSSAYLSGINLDVVRKAADCLHLQLYREPKDRYKKGQTKASLSLQHFLGFESGFTLDKESNTIAIICQDVSVVLALETRERLIAWQVKLSHQLGTSKDFLVMISGGNKKLPAGPARLHLQGQKFALTAGLPPRLLGLWEIPHLRRYGVVESRFCFEGGSYCGKGEGLHVLITDQAQQITDAFDIATYGSSNQYTISRKSETLRGNNNMRPDTRLSDNSYDQSLPDTASALYEDNYFGEDCGTTSPLWPSDERRGFSDGKSLWEGANHITLERCTNCQTKLGSSARSSTVALGPFNPAWTMDPAPENNPAYQMQQISFPSDIDSPPQRPPKPQNFEQCKPPALLPTKHPKNDNNLCINNSKVGPYENYDVPKPISFDKHKDEHYDTPKRLKNNLADELFQVSNEAPPGSLVLTKTCGCLLKFGSKKKATIIECEENIQPVECPCQKVTNWANNLISLPYCKRKPDNIRTEILQEDSLKAIYATVDVSRKTSRKNESETNIVNNKLNFGNNDSTDINYENIEPKDTSTQHYSNYVNLDFAMSLEYYENAKDLLKKAGLTQTELDALSASVTKVTNTLPKRQKLCSDCKKCQSDQFTRKNKSDDYLLMQPADDSSRERCQTLIMNPGYTPMCPNPKWSHSLRHPLQKSHSETDKFSSSPVLNQNNFCSPTIESLNIIQNQIVKIRCSSVESTSMNENADSTEQSQDTSCSLETLRNLNFNNSDISNVLPSDNHVEREKTTELPPLRKIINMHSKRPSSVPSKTGCNRDSSSSNDSGVSSCSMKQVCTEFQEYESAQHFPKQLVLQRNFQEDIMNSAHPPLPRKSKSSDPIKDLPISIHCTESNKSSSAEAEVPVLPTKHFRNVADTRSTSSGTSDMSDYFETLSVSSSQSSSDALSNMRISRQPTNTLRPRSGKEYHNLDPTITSMYKTGKDLSNYTNIP